MAKILFGAGVGDARGSVGAVTFTKGRNGAVLRSKVSPVQPRSSAVLAIRAFFQTLSKNWANTLTDAERAGWNALAAITSFNNAFGNAYHPTGLQIYQLCNRNLQLIDQAVISAAPANLDVDTPLTLTAVADVSEAKITVAFTPTPVPAGHHLACDMGPQYNFGRAFVGNNYKFIFYAAAAAAGPFSIESAYFNKYGALKLGCKLPVRIWFIKTTTGAASQPISSLITVIA